MRFIMEKQYMDLVFDRFAGCGPAYLHSMKGIFLAAIMPSAMGAAGQAQYFQQRVDTRIEVRLDDKRHFLHGFEQFRYTNNAPDTLRYIYVHLWPNAYSSDRTRFSEQQVINRNTGFYFSKAGDRGFIDSLDFRVNGQPATPFSAAGLPDIARIDLPDPLPPGATIAVETPFRVKIPKVFSRMGHTGQAYYISQWFPKPAVYDRKGWHPLPYSDQGEFFSEIGAYDVQITLPANYVVMATGNCTDAAENSWLDSLSVLPAPGGARPANHVAAWREKVNTFPPSSANFKTLHFHEDNVHDFAWFADKRFIVRRDSVAVVAGSGVPAHTVRIYTGFLTSEKDYWEKGAEYIRKTISAYSEEIGPYPYNTAKAVEGDLKAGGGMEYPTVTVIDRLATQTSVMETLVHEIGHNWFYGILASNERDDAWMDEGFNTFYERKVEAGIRLPMGRKERYTNRIEDVLYYNAASTRSDQSLLNTSSSYTKGNYGLDVYYKAALLLKWLEGYVGADTFKEAMHRYYDAWHFRHPYPEDVRTIFQETSGKPVGWFFDGALKTEIGIDFALKGARHDGDGFHITAKNKSDFAAPVRINAYIRDSLLESVWSLPFAKDTTLLMGSNNASGWRVGYEIPDYYGFNNRYHRYGLLHGKTVRIKGGISLGRREAAELYILPALGYNEYDGFMAGLLLHNLTVPQNRFRYMIAGLYGTGSKDFVAAASLGYWIYPHHIFRELVPQIDVKTLNYDRSSQNISEPLNLRYIKLSPSLNFTFGSNAPLSPVTRSLLLKGYSIWEEEFQFSRDKGDTTKYIPTIGDATQSNYGLLRYTHKNARTFNPFSYVIEGQLGSSFAKLSIEGNLRVDYNVRNKSLYLRGYAGKFFQSGPNDLSGYRYWLTTTYTAENDYLYDGSYFGRSEREGASAQQISIQEGGQKLPTPLYALPLGRSDDWLVGLNIKSDLPFGSLPVRLYLDAGTYANAARVNPSGNRFLYSAGLELHALRDVFLVHVPLLLCSDYRDYLKSIYPDNQFAHSITFSVQFQNVNWLRIISSGMRYYLF